MKKLLTIFCMTALLASCSKNDKDVVVETSAIKITPVITKATDTSFEVGDKMGLTIIKANGNTHVANLEMPHDDTSFHGMAKWYYDTD